jgi:lipoprotein NlpI
MKESKAKSSKGLKKVKVSQMMNLRPVVEKDFNAIGIYYADQIICS